MKKYWLHQILTLGGLLILAVILHMFMIKSNSLLSIDNIILRKMFVIIMIMIILFADNLLLYNYARQNHHFMKHKIWNKMHIIILCLLIASFFAFVVLFSTTSWSQLIQNQIWLLYIIIFYFLYFINLFILSVIHQLAANNIPVEKKLMMTWLVASLLVVLIIFFIPSI
ncbi:putative membrane protein [Anoxybacillus sp. B7M1]|jgi:hypothetical protein|uniref:hypothetical protein n=1 Tax=unclassified Anoxybacillus TaxID=2639704 RepID=UPI0005CCA729|nr:MULTISPECIES: hypothetical protein [unclassified Anoxybacillus]ANB58025.1 putative membrane protein [Anoxybacillus sp. B2M1]ANB64116.1 putative membrane protein [Anoxybacillus sp. B7M1]